MQERSFEFRKRLNVVHRPDRRDFGLQPAEGEAALEDGWRIVVADSVSEFLIDTAKDLQDYLFTSMGGSKAPGG